MCQSAKSLVLGPSRSGKDLVHLPEIEHPELADRRPYQKVRRRTPELGIDYRPQGDLLSAQKGLDRPREAVLEFACTAADINRDGKIGVRREQVERQRIDKPAVDQDTAVELDRRQEGGQGAACGKSRKQGAT